MRDASGNAYHSNAGTVWADVPTGGGGYTAGPLINPFGRQGIRTDTTGCYLRDQTDAKWTTVIRKQNFADFTDFTTTTTKFHGYNIGWFGYAPSDNNRWYVAFYSRMFRIDIDPAKKLTDAGAITLTKFNLADKHFLGGAGISRWIGENCGIVVHPTDKNIVLFGTNNDGCYYTTDGGDNVSSITIPAGTGFAASSIVTSSSEVGRERYMVAIDQSNPLYCYIFVQGLGLHRSTAGVAGPYTLVPNGPLSCSCMAVNVNGAIWLTADDRVNILTNTTFETDLSSWTAGSSATLSKVLQNGTVGSGAQNIKVLNGAASASYASQAYTGFIVGQNYTFGGTCRSDGTQVDGIIKIGTAPGLSDVASLSVAVGTVNALSNFVATATTLYISLVVNSSTSGAYTIFDDPLISSAGTYKLTTRGGSTWTSYGDVIGQSIWPHHVAIDPFDATGNSVLVWREQPGARFDGTTWSSQMSFSIVAGGECVWRPKSAPQGGGWAFDPTTQNRILGGEGFGVVVVPNYKVTAMQALDYSKGIEGKIDRTYLNIPATGKNFVISWDLANTDLTSLSNYTNFPNQGVVEDGTLTIGAAMDVAIDDPTYIVQAIGTGDDRAAYSTQSGAKGTFHKFAGARPATVNSYSRTGQAGAGAIAVSNKSDIVITPTNSAYASESYDSGATWAPVLLNGSIDYGCHPGYSTTRIPVAADKQRPGWFALVAPLSNPGTSDVSSPLGGLWIRPGSHQTWVRVITGNINAGVSNSDTLQGLRCQIAFLPGYAGEIIYTPYDFAVADPFWYIITDGTPGGTTKRQLNTLIKNVKQFGFGKAMASGRRPTIYFYGTYNSVIGFYAIIDTGTGTWGDTVITMSDAYPNGYMSQGTGAGVGGDMTVFGRAFCVIDGKGSVFSAYSDPMTFT